MLRRLGAGAVLLPLLASAAWAADPATAGACDQARRLAADGRVKQAIEVLDRAAAVGLRTTELYDLRAQLHLATGDQDAAERDWRRAAQLDPANSRSRLSLAKLYARRGLWGDAIAYYREILLVEPRNADAVLGLAEAYQKIGRTVGAQNLLQAASEDLDDRRVHERWARVAEEAGRPQDAEHALRRIVAMSEGTARRDALLALAQLYLSLSRPQDALAAAREAVSIGKPAGPVSEATYDSIALATDYEVQEIGRRLQGTLGGLDSRSLIREEAFAAIVTTRARLADAQELLSQIGAPEARRSAHARRLYAYALADEASLNALANVDLGLADQRTAFDARLAEARTEINRLSPAGSSH
jgi:tetratricopeptide (TPR) repeat protein